MAGNPINLATGNKFEDELDEPGEGLFPLQFHRFYNGNGAGDGVTGAHWSHTFSRQIAFWNSTSVDLTRDDGQVLPFQACGDTWCGDADERGVLTAVKTSSGGITQWRYVDPNHITEIYDGGGRFLSETDRNGLTHAMVYDRNGHLIDVKDSNGRHLLLAYGSDGRLGTLTLPSGFSVQYAYSPAGYLTSATYGDGSSRTYLYDEPEFSPSATPSALLTGIVDEQEQRFATFGYDADGHAILSTHAGNSGKISLSFGDDGASSVTDALGALTKYTIQDVVGIKRQKSADGAHCTNCSPFKAFTFSSVGDLIATTDWNGSISTGTFNSAHLEEHGVESQGTAAERTTDTTWNNALREPLTRTIEDAFGSVVSKTGWAYNEAGQVTASCLIDPIAAPSYVCSASGVAPLGVRRTVNTYCAAVDTTTCPIVGLQIAVDGPRTDIADTTSYAYYLTTDESGCASVGNTCHHLGDLKSTTDGAGLVTTYVSYDKAGRATRVRDPNGVLTDYTYTPRGWLATKTVRADTAGVPSTSDAITTIVYDPTGTVHSVQDPDGVTTTYAYDAAHRLTDITDASGARIHYTLDAAGNRTNEQVLSSTGAVSRALGRTFNPLGQLTALTDGLNRTVFAAGFTDSYDGNGNLVHSQDGLGVQKKLSYDGLNRLVSTIRDYQGTNDATADAQSVTSFDALDRVTGFSDPDSLNTTYDIDAFGNVTGLHSPDSGTTTRTFDISGDPLTSVDATSISKTFTHDVLGRLTGTTYPDTALNVAYRYDEADAVTGCVGSFAKGRLTRIVEGNGGLVYCYDSHGNVVTKQQTVGTVTTTTRYTWTLGGRLASVTTSNGTMIAYSRDAVGRISTVTATPLGGTATTVASNVAYQPFGPIASYTLGDGQTVTRAFDANGQLTDIASTAFSLHVARDAMGHITAVGDASGASPALETYGYDPLYRLTKVNDASGNAVEAYTYNKTGDRLSKVAPGLLTGAYSYEPGTHRLVAVGAMTRQVDARGNTMVNNLASGAFAYGYNQRNRLTSVQKDGGTIGTYVLNALGQRVQKTANEITTRFDYDEGGQLLAENAGTTSRDYAWLDDLPVGIIDRGASTAIVSFIHADGLGSPRAVTDATGAVQWKWPYAGNPFGESAPVSASGYALNLRFPGQYFDAESGLNYNVNRDYEPATGRYIQSDPLGLFGGQFSTYAYVQNNPLHGVDSLGLSECKKGHWVQVGSIVLNLDLFGSVGSLVANNVCRCVWLWVPAEGSYMWSGNPQDPALPRTTGHPTGMGGDPTMENKLGHDLGPSPSSCICSPPPPKD